MIFSLSCHSHYHCVEKGRHFDLVAHSKVLLLIHYEKSCSQRPHYFETIVQKPFKYNCVVITSSKVQLQYMQLHLIRMMI
jgi:hypothetical protein